MTLKDLLKKKERIEQNDGPIEDPAVAVYHSPVPEFKIVRSTTTSFETIDAVQSDQSRTAAPTIQTHDEVNRKENEGAEAKKKHRFSHFRRKSGDSTKSNDSASADEAPAGGLTSPPKEKKRLSARFDRLHIRSPSHSRSRSHSRGSSHVPQDLPDIERSVIDNNAAGTDAEELEAKWEKRATLLAQDAGGRGIAGLTSNSKTATTMAALISAGGLGVAAVSQGDTSSQSAREVSSLEGDETVQEAIRLHETGDAKDLERSTQIFGTLASPHGTNNAFAQVMYGLCLRHGWGIEADPSRAMLYLAKAASNSAAVESEALAHGLQKGGKAKGELVMAIYELANSYRHGWGVEKDLVAARTYYETAANLGDVDAMVELADALEHGWGGKKDKFRAAQYLRRAEGKGKKEVGNSWIWKEKYNPKPESTS